MGNTDETSAGDLLWQDARMKYEDPSQDLSGIAATLGINKFKLVIEARLRGWKLRGARKDKSGAATSSTRGTIQRLKELLQNRLAQLETQIGALGDDVTAANSERDIRAVNTLVRTLEKVLELERKDRNIRARKIKQRRDLNDAERAELVRRIAGLRRAPDGSELRGSDGASPGSGDAAGLAQLGPA
jgi:hypothetical protein